MEIRIEIPKIVYEDSNLTRLKRTISTGYYLRSGTGTGAIRNYYFQGLSPTLHDNDIVRVYNIIKVNAVRKETLVEDIEKYLQLNILYIFMIFR